jgi:hypothetical protein
MVEGEINALVLCEGKDDKRVLECLLEDMGIVNVEVQSFDGKAKLRQGLVLLKSSPKYTSGEYGKILITRDADDNWSSAWDSVRNAVADVLGAHLGDVNQWTRINEDTRVMAWIFPGKETPGMIESLCLGVAREGDSEAFQCMDDYAECLERNHQAVLHEKSRFAIWTISAQTGENARKFWDFKKVLKQLPFNWKSGRFQETREVLANLAG